VKWDFQVDFTIARGRKIIVKLSDWFPFKQLHKRHKAMVQQCYRKKHRHW
jgi:hypothetical protein